MSYDIGWVASRLKMLLLFGLLVITAIILMQARPAKAASCSTAGIVGTATTTVTVGQGDADNYKTWLELRGSSSTGTIAIEIDGTNCITQAVSNVQAGTHGWFGIGTAQSYTAGTHTIKVISYTNGMYLRNGILINDTCVPTGEAANCATVATTLNPPTTVPPTTPPPTSAPPTTVPPTTVPPTTAPPTTAPPTTVSPNSCSGTNLALNKTATASSIESAKLTAAKAVDGSTARGLTLSDDSRWASLSTDPQWLVVDLGARFNINCVKIFWETAAGKDYQIQVADTNDANTSWNTVKYVYGNAESGNLNYSGLSGAGRYVRIYGTARATQYGYSIFELNVYGTSAPVSPTSPPPAISDSTPPTAPGNLTAQTASSGQINLAWTASTDNIGVVGYIILRNGVEVNRVYGVTSYSDTFLPASNTFKYTVKAIDKASNQSRESNQAQATTQCGWFKC